MTRKKFIQSDPQVIRCPETFKKNVSIIIEVKCITCNKIINVSLNNYWKRRKNGPWSCYSCLKPIIAEKSRNNPLYKNPKYRDRFRKLHNDPEYHSKVHNKEVRKKISESERLAWQDPEKREHHLAHRSTTDYREHIGKWATKRWADPEYRRQQFRLRRTKSFYDAASKRSKKLWQDPQFRKKIEAILNKARINSVPQNAISSYQLKLYQTLDDLGVIFHREGPETKVGPFETSKGTFEGYSFDCRIPLSNCELFIECNSAYTHPPQQEPKDRAKATFLLKYVPNAKLVTFWDLDFRNPWLLREHLSQLLGLSTNIQKDFDFKEVTIRPLSDMSQLCRFFGYYHYLANIGRAGSNRYGAFLSDELIAASIFSAPTRSESSWKQGVGKHELFELTRFCIHLSYHKKDLASWFLSRSISSLWRDQPKAKVIISFVDTTMGHEGTIYKASGWMLDGTIPPDYWYYRPEGGWIHKKTVWDLACKFSLSEEEYSKRNQLIKIWGKEKLRFVLRRK